MTVTREAALTALDDLDDFARMTVGVDAHGARETLRRFIQEVDPWRDAVIDEASCLFLSEDGTPREVLKRVIAANVQIALDPAVSSEAQALIDRGAAEDDRGLMVALQDILDGKDDGAGVCTEPWGSLRRRVLELVKGPHSLSEYKRRAALEPPLQDHQIAQTVNALTAIAKEYGHTQQLRERIAHVVVPILKGEGFPQSVVNAYAPREG